MSNEHAMEMVIGHENGMVVQKFKGAVDRVDYEPENAISVAEALTSNAFEARDGMKPVGDTLKAELVERHRKKLYNRLGLVLNSTRENRTISNSNLARQLVDICLSEIF